MAGEMRQLAQTPLGEAIVEGEVRCVRRLLESGENAKFVDRKGNTYLHFVSTMYRPYIINVLMAFGADIAAQNKHGNTALHVTALHDECCPVTDLMACGVDPYVRNQDGKLAEDLAKNNNRWMDLYKKYMPTLRQAVVQHDVERVKYLLGCWSACHLTVNGKDMRQFSAALTFHDLVSVIDKARFSLLAIHSVLENDYKSLDYALSRGADCNVNFLQQLDGSHPHHILQHAIRQGDCPMVDRLLEAGADVNTMVQIKDYIRGPLFFEVLRCDRPCQYNKAITATVMAAKVDLVARDERGRTALIYCLDRRNGENSVELVETLLAKGANIAARDSTGCTARDVAALTRRNDMVAAIDKHLIEKIKESNMAFLRKIVTEGYEDIIVQYKCRDTWIYAAGNDSADVTDFLQSLDSFNVLASTFRETIRTGSVDDLERILHNYSDKEMLLRSKDKGGRSSLLLAILHGRQDVAMWLLRQDPSLARTERDNSNRSALHYAYALTTGELRLGTVQLLQEHGTSEDLEDVRGIKPADFVSKMPDFIATEKATVYGMDMELHCMKKYEALLEIIRSKSKDSKHFNKVLKTIRYPVADFPKLLGPVVERYRDLILCAVDHEKTDLAKKLVNIKVDCSLQEKYTDSDGTPCWMNASQRARCLGLLDLADYIDARGSLHKSAPGAR